MLRYTPAFAALFAAASVSAQQPAGSPQPGSPQRPAQTTEINGADQNQTRDRNTTTQPGSRPAGSSQVAPGAQSAAPPRNDVPGQNAQGNRNQARGGGRQGQSMEKRFDAHVADCLILGNQEEVALLKFGMEQTKSEKVKEAAKMMMKDHEQAISQLREHASKQHANVELTSAEKPKADGAQTREALKVADDSDSSEAGQNNMPAKMYRMARLVHENSLMLNRKELEKYEGSDFDQAFLGQQLGAHVTMLAKLKAAEKETSSDLSEWTVKAQETTKKHKDHLEKMMNEIGEKSRDKK